ncbi:1-deoxy-D-xylulose 5-phosphate reductoisomerase [Candidatus Thiomargarita nelsonii]|uniref:1-deoxy-D-xylulose 5-phosphate reductoisomerase n=1 Tax=Candidatus Thiomargarita nelsonii TaxID=1003181 RepID=A0A0A6RRM3_9GAMM|nr:1-deoxy-D-xylulose 5-phosphate reductoisomerase [Candidatus Thiomargarita nelsonii]
MKKITILGATGTIGINTLDVIKRHSDEFEVVALTGHRQIDRLAALCFEWSPRYAVMADSDAAAQLEQRLKNTPVQVLSGTSSLSQVASLPEVDIVMAAIVGAAGLLPTLAAAQAGKRVLLANKEALVMSGQLFMDAVREHGAELLPIDSEHNAVFQCMPPSAAGISRILLTASGGPFRSYPIEQLHDVTPDQACAHPNWNMGRKISVDSATMMNKGLEIIEACWLFSAPPEQIDVVLHPQSVIHSMVEYVDGSVLAQLGNPDMRTPIAYGLAWPDRIDSGVPRLNLIDIARLDFEAVDFERFPCLKLASEAMLAGGTTSTILNAANEVAVEAFLQERLRFTAIPKVIETTLSQLTGRMANSLEVILEDDARARELAFEAVKTDN